MSIHKAQGQTLQQCGVLLPEPVFTHGQLYVCASRASSASGLRFWLGDASDGHGYHADGTTGRYLPHTQNIIFKGVLSMVTVDEAQKASADPAFPRTSATQEVGEGTQDPEYLELPETGQRSLHKTLYHA